MWPSQNIGTLPQKSLLDWKNIFAYGPYESLERLEGKTEEGTFFQIFDLIEWQCDLTSYKSLIKVVKHYNFYNSKLTL